MNRGFLKLGFLRGLRDGAEDRGKRKRFHGGRFWTLLIISDTADLFPVEEDDEEEKWTRIFILLRSLFL